MSGEPPLDFFYDAGSCSLAVRIVLEERTAYIEFQVEDIDADCERLKDKVPLVHEMKLMPWGNNTSPPKD